MEIMDVEYLYSVQYPNTLVGILKVLLIVWVLEDKNNFWFLLEIQMLRPHQAHIPAEQSSTA